MTPAEAVAGSADRGLPTQKEGHEFEKSFAPESAHLKYPTSRAAMAHLLPGRSDATPRLPATAEAAATLHPTPIHGPQQDP
jgi:hypothetical protein